MFGIQPTKWGIGKTLQNTKIHFLVEFCLSFSSSKVQIYEKIQKDKEISYYSFIEFHRSMPSKICVLILCPFRKAREEIKKFHSAHSLSFIVQCPIKALC